jgi:hypothetical protein
MTVRDHQFDLASRSSVEGFLQRTIRNLEWMLVQQKAERANVHLGTQLTLSMLGLFVFPDADEDLKNHLETFSLRELTAKGWPDWDISLDKPTRPKGKTTSLGTLLWHVRNALSHRRLTFSSESLELSEIQFQFQDAPNKSGQINWEAHICGPDLLEFCRRLAELIIDHYA